MWSCGWRRSSEKGEESASFLKKRSKKLLCNWGMGGFTRTAQSESKVFCALFFKKAPLSFTSH